MPRFHLQVGVRLALAAALCLVPLRLAANAASVPAMLPLQLEVSINGRRTELIGSFTSDAQGQLSATGKELRALGLRVENGDDDIIPLNSLSGLTYRYDAARQSVDIMPPAERLEPQLLGPKLPSGVSPSDESMIAVVLNYGLTGAIYDDSGSGLTRNDWSHVRTTEAANLDARLTGPLGALRSSGIVGNDLAGGVPYVRLESSWNFSNQEAMRTLHFGDLVTRGPVWTRPLRLGGAQVQSNFALRPDLITAPLPTFAGNAAVPSSVDVFINNSKAYSQQVQPGPFVISNLSLANSSGTASIVVRDEAGRETVQNVSFYNSPVLLKSGLYDYSFEVGVARENYGLQSFDYDDHPVGSASLRTGISDWLTLDGHAEGGYGLANVGAGAAMSVLGRSVWTLAGAASTRNGAQGLLGYAAVETAFGPISLHLSTQRTVGNYRDLASVVSTLTSLPYGRNTFTLVPETLDIASISYAITDTGTNFGFNVVNREGKDGNSRILAGSISQQIGPAATVICSGTYDLSSNSTGLFVGLSVPLGELGHAQIGANRDPSGTGGVVTYSKPAGQEPGSFGWQVSDNEGRSSARAASATYQGSAARIEAGVANTGSTGQARLLADGALVATSRGVFLAKRVDDAFAVVDVGEPDVDVSLDNRKVARTDANGVALVPGLRSYQRNRLSVDPDSLPPDVEVPKTASVAAPAEQGGTSVDLKASRSRNSAIVELRLADGGFVPAGARGEVTTTGKPFIVGYDGRAFIDSLATANTVKIDLGERSCSASFEYKPRNETQTVIHSVQCL